MRSLEANTCDGVVWRHFSLFCAPRLSVRVPIGQTSSVQASPVSWESLLCVRMASLQTGRTRTIRNSSRTLSKTDTASQETKKLIWEEYKRNHKGSIPPQVEIKFLDCEICLSKIILIFLLFSSESDYDVR